MPQIRAKCEGTCKRRIRLTKAGAAKYGTLCRPCYKARHGKPRPITGRTKKARVPRIKAAPAQKQKGKK